MGKTTKSDIIKAIAESHGTTQSAVQAVVDGFLDVVADSLTLGEEVNLHNFGTFRPVDRKARLGRNPKTGEAVDIAASRAATFKPAKALKERMND